MTQSYNRWQDRRARGLPDHQYNERPPEWRDGTAGGGGSRQAQVIRLNPTSRRDHGPQTAAAIPIVNFPRGDHEKEEARMRLLLLLLRLASRYCEFVFDSHSQYDDLTPEEKDKLLQTFCQCPQGDWYGVLGLAEMWYIAGTAFFKAVETLLSNLRCHQQSNEDNDKPDEADPDAA